MTPPPERSIDPQNRHQDLRLSRDGWLLFAARLVRMFAYGLLSTVLMLYLSAAGMDDGRIGLLMTLTLLGDTAITFWLSTNADRIGRKRTLLIGALLMTGAGLAFAMSTNFFVLLLAATIGVISPSATEIGPFLSVEQAAISELIPGRERTRVFAWYHLVGYCAGALGAFVGGYSVSFAREQGATGTEAFQYVVWGYSLCGVVLAILFAALHRTIEPFEHAPQDPPPAPMRFGLHRSRSIIARLSALFALDAFGGGFILQAIISFWLARRFGLPEQTLGQIFLAANLLSGASALMAGSIARRFGLINTMVFTHLPSNVLLMLVPFMPDALSAVGLLLLRYAISQLDLPTRQAFTMAVVAPDERSAAAGVTNVARSIGGSLSPYLATTLMGWPALMSAPFLLAGGCKIVYDILLFRAFANHREDSDDPGSNSAR
ncbi:Major Facilitator Superfamily protein [Caulifigura coniformis]|uniref:Major Facilitator Superfamily protein n=1 Tax=Caulifigura coniformis TaxID=2527983 RepID=A0A517S8Y5_9PLAN|nr:MFS transporter [Caulifigura coniformis]QDT52572.1 Major Facilitator Superfamily protein [Caulifigura coniformis]